MKEKPPHVSKDERGGANPEQTGAGEFDDLLIDLAPPAPSNVELHFEINAAEERERPPLRFALRPREDEPGPFRSAFGGGESRELIERAEWMRTLSDRVSGKYRARLLGVVSRLLERGGDPRHEKLLEAALLEAPENPALLRRASDLAELSGDKAKLDERLRAELEHMHDPIARAPREVKRVAALGTSREAMALARGLREAHPGEADFALLALLVAERLGDPNEIAQALAAAIRSVDAETLKSRLALRLADHARRGAQHAAAKAWAEFAMGIDPSNGAAHLLRVSAARALGDEAALREALSGWLSELPDSALRRALIRWSLRLSLINIAKGGSSLIPESALSGDQNVEAYRLRADLALARRDRQSARDALRGLIRHAAPLEQAPALRDLAMLAATDGDRALAQRALREASYLEGADGGHAARLLSLIAAGGGAIAEESSAQPEARLGYVTLDPLAALMNALASQDIDAARAIAREERFAGDASLAILASTLELLGGDQAASAKALRRELESRPEGARSGALLLLALIDRDQLETKALMKRLPADERRELSVLIEMREDAEKRGVRLSALAAKAAIETSERSSFAQRRRAIAGEVALADLTGDPRLREILLVASRRAIPDTLFEHRPSLRGDTASSDPLVRLAEARLRSIEGDTERARARLRPANTPELRLALAEIELRSGEPERARALLRELLASNAPPRRAARLLETLSEAASLADDWLLAFETQLHSLSSEEILASLERALFEPPRRGAFELFTPRLVERHSADRAVLEMLETGLSAGPARMETLIRLGRSAEHSAVKRIRLLGAAALAEAAGDQKSAAALRAEVDIAIPARAASAAGALARGVASIDTALVRGEIDAAELRYDALHFDHQEAPELALRGARILRAKGQSEAAIETLRGLLERDLDLSLRRDALLDLAPLLDTHRGDPAAAIACLEEILEGRARREGEGEKEQAAQDAAALCFLAPLKLRTGARDEARLLLYRAIEAARAAALGENNSPRPILGALSYCLDALGLRASSEMIGSLNEALIPNIAPSPLPRILSIPQATSAVSADLIEPAHLAFFSVAQPAFSALSPFSLNAFRIEPLEASPELEAQLIRALGGPPPALYQCSAPPALVFSADPQGRRVVIHSGLLRGLGARELLFLSLGAVVRARLGVGFMDREPTSQIAALLNALFHASSAPQPYPNALLTRPLFDSASLALAGEDPRIAAIARSAPKLPPVESLSRRLGELSLRLALLSTGDALGAKRALEACAKYSRDALPYERLISFALSRPAIERRHLLSRDGDAPSR